MSSSSSRKLRISAINSGEGSNAVVVLLHGCQESLDRDCEFPLRSQLSGNEYAEQVGKQSSLSSARGCTKLIGLKSFSKV